MLLDVAAYRGVLGSDVPIRSLDLLHSQHQHIGQSFQDLDLQIL